MDFYVEASGATVVHRVGEGDDIVAQLSIGEAAFWVASAGPDIGRFSPPAIGGATGRTLLVAEDPEAVADLSVPRISSMALTSRVAFPAVRP